MKKADKPRVLKEKRRLKITKIGNERGDITTKLTKIKTVWQQFRQPRRMDKFLEIQLPKLTQQERGNFNRTITNNALVAQTVKNLPSMQETTVWSWVKKIPWRRSWQPALVFLPGESHRQRSLSIQSTRLQRVGHDWQLTHTHIHHIKEYYFALTS